MHSKPDRNQSKLTVCNAQSWIFMFLIILKTSLKYLELVKRTVTSKATFFGGDHVLTCSQIGSVLKLPTYLASRANSRHSQFSKKSKHNPSSRKIWFSLKSEVMYFFQSIFMLLIILFYFQVSQFSNLYLNLY